MTRKAAQRRTLMPRRECTEKNYVQFWMNAAIIALLHTAMARILPTIFGFVVQVPS